MKTCANCGAQLDDSNSFCTVCGSPLEESAPAAPEAAESTAEQAPETEENDLARNKIFGILVYVASLLGIIVALLAAPDSPFVRFHVRQAVKLTICEAIVALASVLLAWTVIVPIAGAVAGVILAVVSIICLVNACKGLTKEPPIVKNIGFLK